MDPIAPLYHNDAGISFYWKREGQLLSERVQLVFRDTGFYFTDTELRDFKTHITAASQEKICCRTCTQQCRKLLLRTPCAQIDLAVTTDELLSLDDLVEGTLFKLELLRFLYGDGRN